ncbi:PorV/PorQ family protein [Candidatus Margulisiibacteriota bacterium]
MKKLLAIILILGFAATANAVTGVDPMRIGVGARALGMGRAYVAIAEDADTIFINPAGLGTVMKPKLSSMYSNLLSDVNYIVAGGAYPFADKSAIGAGLITANVGDIELYDTAGTSLGTGSWGNSVIFASYGTRLAANDKLKVGGSLKYFSNGGTDGTGTTTISSAAGTGFGLDAGMLYSVNENVNVGAVAQNVFNGGIESGHGISNEIPATIKAGVAFSTLIGEKRKLNLAADYDLNSGSSDTLHLGAELFLTPMLALRAGMDQDPAPEGTATNITAGVGLRVQGVSFDFAYHPYSSVTDDTSYFFSVGYVGAPEPKELDLEMAILSPTDKSIVYTDSVAVTGTLKGKSTKGITVVVNDTTAAIANDGTFTASVPVSQLGKKLLHFEASDEKGRKLTEDRRILRLVSFNDVNQGYWAKAPIEHTGTVGLVQGYPDSTFRPDRSLTRAELATLLVRAKGYKLPGHPIKVFKDVSSKHWAAGYVEIAMRTGLVKGYPDGKFRPNNRINKAEAITVLARFDGLAKKFGKTAFRDVKSNHWSAGYVNAAEEAGMLSWVSTESLGPKEAVTRAESVKMLSGTSLAASMIDSLLSWDKGFQFEITKPTIKAAVPAYGLGTIGLN